MPRIDKVRLDTTYSQYRSSTGPVRRADQADLPPGFDPEEKGVVYEPSGAKPERKARIRDAGTKESNAKDVNTKESNVKDVNAKAANVKEADKKEADAKEARTAASPERDQRSVGEALRDLGSRILTFFKNALRSLWYGPEGKTKDKAEEQPGDISPVSPEVSSPQTEKADPSAELQQIIQSHDVDQLVRYVTEDGMKKPARSTDVLTIYNRYGRVNYVAPSDRKKILEGNFDDIKL